jgi:hypothetical protein
MACSGPALLWFALFCFAYVKNYLYQCGPTFFFPQAKKSFPTGSNGTSNPLWGTVFETSSEFLLSINVLFRNEKFYSNAQILILLKCTNITTYLHTILKLLVQHSVSDIFYQENLYFTVGFRSQ